jgi:hypothetical protein
MTLIEAKRLLESLAQGLNPKTGHALPEDNPVHSPDVIRALNMAVMALHKSVEKPLRPKMERASKAGQSWSPEEDEQLLSAFDAGSDVPALAKAHERSRGGITSRLIRHGRLQADRREDA